MITGVTLNPCNDLTVSVQEFSYGGMNRVIADRMDIAGKGYNFARCVAKLGMHAGATGMLYLQNGKATEWAMRQDGIFTDCVWQEGRIRTNIKLYDEKNQTITEINQNGTPLTKTAIEAVKNKVVEFARRSELICFSGSLPPECPDDFYKTLIGLCKPLCKTALDAGGRVLSLGIEAQPAIVKPNLFELETALGRELNGIPDIVLAAQEIIHRGVEVVCVTMGTDGAVIVTDKEACHAPMVNVEVQSTVGAGDALLAGVVVTLMQNGTFEDALRLGIAAAAAACTLPGTQIIDRELTEKYLDKVTVEKL